MNIINCKEVLENTKQYPLYSVVVFWKSPLTHEVEYLEAYFTQYYEADLWATKVKNQGQVNSCVAHVVSEIAEYFEYKQCNSNEKLSPGYIYGKRYEYTGEGMYLRDALKTLKNSGICNHDTFPYNKEVPEIIELFKDTSFDTEILNHYKINSYFRCKSVEDIKDALMKYGPVMISVPWYTDNSLKDNIIVKGTVSNGYHALLVYGWNEKGFLIQNSWGIIWGKKGKAVLPYDYEREEAWGVIDTTTEEYNIIKPKSNRFIDVIYKILNFITI